VNVQIPYFFFNSEDHAIDILDSIKYMFNECQKQQKSSRNCCRFARSICIL